MMKLLGGLFLALSLVLLGGAGASGDSKKTKGKVDFEAFFNKLDTNMDGKLSKDEFVRMAERAKEKETAREKLEMAYARIDPEKKGITRDQFRKFLELRKKDEK